MRHRFLFTFLFVILVSSTCSNAFAQAGTRYVVIFLDESGMIWSVPGDGAGETKLSAERWDRDAWRIGNLPWSSDGRWLALRQKGNLWVMSADGQIKQKVVSADSVLGNVRFMQWLPNNHEIVFTQSPDANQFVHLGKINLDAMNGIENARGVIFKAPSGYGAFSLAAPVVALNDYFDIQIIDASSGKQITQIKEFWCNGTVEQITWSPTQSWFSHYRYGNGRYSRGWVCVSNIQGETFAFYQFAHAGPPFWSLDGSKLYIPARGNIGDNQNVPQETRLFAFDIETRQFAALPIEKPCPPVSHSTLWRLSPDGKWLACFFGEGNQSGYRVISTQTFQTKTFLRPNGFFSASFSWTPQSEGLIFSTSGLKRGGLYVLNLKDSNTTRLTLGDHLIQEWSTLPIKE